MVIKKFSVDHHIFCNSKWANPFQDPEMGQQFLTHSQNGSKPETGRNSATGVPKSTYYDKWGPSGSWTAAAKGLQN